MNEEIKKEKTGIESHPEGRFLPRSGTRGCTVGADRNRAGAGEFAEGCLFISGSGL